MGIEGSFLAVALYLCEPEHVVNGVTCHLGCSQRKYSGIVLRKRLRVCSFCKCYKEKERHCVNTLVYSTKVILTFANIVCLLLSSSARPRVKKNWLPLSWGPALAMATKPLRLKRNLEWNSSCGCEHSHNETNHRSTMFFTNGLYWMHLKEAGPWMASHRWTLLLFLYPWDHHLEWWIQARLCEILCHCSNLESRIVGRNYFSHQPKTSRGTILNV